ncbi:hypothetical protein EUX98_g7236 [Antrodiella citrinella]|uniref:Uncharacterized protein n=1 Tax=Antrodiella citrinella TaxID=2447956 RepID=A0A4S4MM11_9APHY|nr:hypothetical protein EUX98_g7236 [Antrodiella citrinella]
MTAAFVVRDSADLFRGPQVEELDISVDLDRADDAFEIGDAVTKLVDCLRPVPLKTLCLHFCHKAHFHWVDADDTDTSEDEEDDDPDEWPSFNRHQAEDRATADPIHDYLESMDVDAYIHVLADTIPTLEVVRVMFVKPRRSSEKGIWCAQIVRREGEAMEIQKLDKTTEMAIACTEHL